MASLITAGSASHKWERGQIMHIFTKCKLPSILLPYFTGMTCGLQFVFAFVHDYLFGPGFFAESPGLEAGLRLNGSTNLHKFMSKYSCRLVPQTFKYSTCGCSKWQGLLTASPPLASFPWWFVGLEMLFRFILEERERFTQIPMFRGESGIKCLEKNTTHTIKIWFPCLPGSKWKDIYIQFYLWLSSSTSPLASAIGDCVWALFPHRRISSNIYALDYQIVYTDQQHNCITCSQQAKKKSGWDAGNGVRGWRRQEEQGM